MYEHKLFESMSELLLFLNVNEIDLSSIVSIMPFQTYSCDGKSQLNREYEMIYRKQKGE